jgi:hypothetical protein
MPTSYAIDLSLQPATFDLWHVCLAGAVVLLLILWIITLIALVTTLSRRRQAPASAESATPEPIVKVVEKIVEVEKIVPGPAPDPVILKEATTDAALQLLGLLQKEARFLDFVKEDLTAFNDADIGVAARVVHEGCKKVLNEHFTFAAIRTEQEGSRISVPTGFDASLIRLTGNVAGMPPFNGTLIHKGWQATQTRLPKLTQGYNAAVIAPAEVEL